MHRNRYRLDFTRFATVVFILLAAGSACAESLTPDTARRFVADKLLCLIVSMARTGPAGSMLTARFSALSSSAAWDRHARYHCRRER